MRLGALLEDELTGFQGYAVERAEHLDGTIQYRLQPHTNSEMELPRSEWFDCERVHEVVPNDQIGVPQ